MLKIICALILSAFLFSVALFSAAQCQQPQILHAELSTRQADHGLTAALDQLKPLPGKTWVGYLIATNTPYRNGWTSQHITYLESDGYRADAREDHRQESAESDHAVLLLRISAGQVDRVRSAAADEPLDAGAQRFVWLTGVSAEDSAGTLRKLILAARAGQIVDSGVFLLSLHRSATVVPTLVALAMPGNPAHTREQATFWLANQRGKEGFLALQTMLREPAAQDADFRQKLAFDLTLSRDPEAVTELIRMAHQDPSPAVRKQAQFWMATRGGELVASSLRDSAERDPDEDTRKQAVFAISRLPGAEATTQLTKLAESSKYPEVRKQAIFWLGQSSDPGALAYLTKLLTTSSHP